MTTLAQTTKTVFPAPCVQCHGTLIRVGGIRKCGQCGWPEGQQLLKGDQHVMPRSELDATRAKVAELLRENALLRATNAEVTKENAELWEAIGGNKVISERDAAFAEAVKNGERSAADSRAKILGKTESGNGTATVRKSDMAHGDGLASPGSGAGAGLEHGGRLHVASDGRVSVEG